jgi:hypothetical protein
MARADRRQVAGSATGTRLSPGHLICRRAQKEHAACRTATDDERILTGEGRRTKDPAWIIRPPLANFRLAHRRGSELALTTAVPRSGPRHLRGDPISWRERLCLASCFANSCALTTRVGV